jgi:hypothetical protein
MFDASNCVKFCGHRRFIEQTVCVISMPNGFGHVRLFHTFGCLLFIVFGSWAYFLLLPRCSVGQLLETIQYNTRMCVGIKLVQQATLEVMKVSMGVLAVQMSHIDNAPVWECQICIKIVRIHCLKIAVGYDLMFALSSLKMASKHDWGLARNKLSTGTISLDENRSWDSA